MIELTPDAACMLYLSIAIGTLIGIWLYQHKRSKKKEVLSFETKHFRCEFCKTSYLDDAIKPLTRCPACHSLNKTQQKT